MIPYQSEQEYYSDMEAQGLAEAEANAAAAQAEYEEQERIAREAIEHTAMEMIKKTAINPNLTPERKMAQINYILLIAEGKAGQP